LDNIRELSIDRRVFDDKDEKDALKHFISIRKMRIEAILKKRDIIPIQKLI